MKIKIYSLILFTAFVSFYLTTKLNQTNPNQEFKELIEREIEEEKNEGMNYGSPNEAMKMDYEKRAYPLGYIPEHWRVNAINHIQNKNILTKPTKTNSLTWTQLGPGNVPGRIRSIVISWLAAPEKFIIPAEASVALSIVAASPG